MAGSPKFKVYRGKEYVAACKHPEDAVCLVMALGGEVRWDHTKWVLWSAKDRSDSYDAAANLIHQRLSEYQMAAYERAGYSLPATA